MLPAEPKQSTVSKRRGHTAGEWALIGIVLLYAVALLVGPLAAILWGALSQGPVAIVEQITTPSAISAFKLTLILSISATVLNTVFGVLVAWILVRDNFRGKRIINGIVDMPFAVSPVIAGFMLILLYGRDGWFTPLTEALGIKVVFAVPGMLLATTFVSLPFVIREVIPVLQHLGCSQENAAYTMGASPWQAFVHITLPNIKWGILYGISLTFARAIGEFGAVLVVSGGITQLTESSTLYIFRSLDDRNEVGAYAMAMVLALLSFSILILMEVFRRHTHEEKS
jgi:sulfate/thiosulfate transport system permease protein